MKYFWNRNNTRSWRGVLAAMGVSVVATLLSACGGGGGGNGTPDPVVVVQAPSITLQPQPVRVMAGLAATFTARASGSGPLAYQWKRNGTAIDGATGEQYSLASRHGDSQAKFSVTVTGPGGSVDSQAAELTVETPVAPAAQAEVQRAELRPNVRLADSTLLARVAGSDNRFKVRAGDWVPGQLFVFEQGAYRVSSLARSGDGGVELRTAPVAAEDVYADLAFKVSFHGVDYDGQGRALSAVALADGRRQALAATNGQRQRRSLAQLITCISIKADYTQKSEAGRPEYGYEYSIDCPLEAFMFGEREESGVRLKGTVIHTSKTDIYYDQNAGTQYHETEVTNGGDFTVAVESLVKLSEARREQLKQMCEASKTKLEKLSPAFKRMGCEVKVEDGRLKMNIDFPLGEPQTLPVRLYGIPIMVGVKAAIAVEIGAGGEVTVGYESKKYLSTGYRNGVKVEDNPPVKLAGFKKPEVRIQTGELDGFLGFGPVFTLGDSASLSAMELSVAIGGYGNVQYALLPPCLDTSVGARLNVNFNIGKSRFWDGWELFDINSNWVWADSKVPLGCEGVPGKAKLVYVIAGRSKYSHDTAASTDTTDVYNAQHALLEPLNQTPPKQIRIDLNDSSVPAGKTLQIEANIVGLAPGAFVSYHETPGANGVVLARYLLVTPGATSYGDTLTIRINAFARGDREATLTTRQVALKFEPKLAAQPYYRRKIDTDGSETLVTEYVFRGDTAAQLAGGLLEYDDGSTELLQRDDNGNWATSTTWTFNTCAWFSRTDCAGQSAAKAPTRLVLYTAASKEGAGQAFPVVFSDRTVVDELVLSPNPVSPYDVLTVKAYGTGMKQQLAINVPNCRNLAEKRADGNLRWDNWASDYREFTCEATAVGSDLVATVEQFPAVFSIVGQDCALQQVLWRGSCVRIGQLLTLPALVTAGEQALLWLADTWSTVASVVFNFVLDGVQQVAAAANQVSETVRHTYQQAGTFILRLVLRDADGQAIAGPAEFWVEVAPGAVQVSPLVAVAGVPQTFTVRSAAVLPQNLHFILPGCDTMTEVQADRGPTLRRFICTFAADTPAGSVEGSVADSSNPFGAPPLGRFAVAVSRAVVGTVSPATTMRTLASSFEISGQNLPTAGITVVPLGDEVSNCQAPNNLTSTGFGVACELFRMGPQQLQVRVGTQVLGTVTVNLTSNVSGVTWTSPSTSNSGTVKFGETVVFRVAGTNLQADRFLGFAVERCGVSNTELPGGSNEARYFSCLFNNEAGAVAGQMPGVVKDAPGGQVLLESWVVPVEVPAPAPTGPSETLEGAFSNSATPRAPWTFGWQATNGAVPTRYGSFTPAGTRTDYPTLAIWNKGAGTTPAQVYPYVLKNLGADPVVYRGDVTPFPAQSVIVTPGSAGERAVFRWTAPSAGAYEVSAGFELMQGGSVDVRVQKNGTDLFVNQITGKGSVASAPVQTVALNAGDVIDFAVGNGGNNNESDITRVWSTVRAASTQRLRNPANGSEYEVITCGNWLKCREVARTRGGALATIRSAAENAWIVTNLLPSARSIWGFWIGFNDRARDGLWVWDSGAPAPYTNWSSWYNAAPNNEDAAHMVKQWGGTWNDTPANDPGGIITEALIEYPTGAIGTSSTINVMDFKATSVNIDTDLSGTCRTGLVYNGPPYTLRPNSGEWDFTVAAAGVYSVTVQYAAQESRPVQAYVDGALLNASALGAVNGTWCATPLMTETIGQLRLTAGSHVLRFDRAGVFPHLRYMWVTRLE